MIKDSRPYRILLIEDNPGDQVLVKTFLSEYFLSPELIRASTYGEAESILIGALPFDVVLLDLSLPDSTGETLIRDVLNLAQTTPVIVLTGYLDFDFGVKSLSFGVADYLLKDDLSAMSLYKGIIYAAERCRITRALEQSERNYADLFHLSPLPIVVVEVSTLKILDVNSIASAEYGYLREEAIGLTIGDILHLSDSAALKDVLSKFNQRRHFSIQGIVRRRVSPGQLMHVDIETNVINYKGIDARMLIISDVTERLNHIAEIEEQNKNLRKIAWIQSHVIRAPLARIMGLVPLIPLEDNEAGRAQLLEYLTTAANELDEVIHNITSLTNASVPQK